MIVHLHELLDAVRRRVVLGLDPVPGAPGVTAQWVRENMNEKAVPPEQVRDLASHLLAAAGETPHPDAEMLLRQLRRRVRPVGVAFSGGGVRSASFCLGFLQALAGKRAGADRDALAGVDYLSTVSGGGYTGGMLSALAHRVRHECPERTKPDDCRGMVLEHLTATKDVHHRHQPFWTRLLHRGQAMGQMLPFFSRHVASTLVFNLTLLGGLTFVCCLLALAWRALDQPPLHTYFTWASNERVLEYNRPLLIPLAVFTCYLIVALSRWDCSWGLRATALALPLLSFAGWLGLPYLVVLSTVLTLFGLGLTLFSGSLRKRRGGKQAQETNRVTWAAVLLFVIVGVKVVYLYVLIATVCGSEDTQLSYPYMLGWTVGMVLMEIGWVVFLSHPQFRQNHQRLGKVMLVATGLSVLAGAAVWVSTPNMNFGGVTTNPLWSGSQDVMKVAVGAIVALLLPFVRLETVLRSGMKAKSSVQRRIFNVLSAVLLLGLPFVLISMLAKHNMSGHAGALPRDLSPGDADWELILRRMHASSQASVRRATPALLALCGSGIKPVLPTTEAQSGVGETRAFDTLLIAKLKDAATRKSEATILNISTHSSWAAQDSMWGRRFSDFVDQTNVAVPIDPDGWDNQIKRFRDGVRLAELASGVLRDPDVVLEMLNNPVIVAELQAAIKRCREEPAGKDIMTSQRKENANQLDTLLKAARARASDDTFVKQVQQGAERETSGERGRVLPKPVREELETIGLLAFTTAYHDVPGTKPFGFVNRPVSIERDQTVRLILCGLTFLLFLAALWTVDLNWASPLSFYRRQLRDVYLTEPIAPDAPPRPARSGRRNDPPLRDLDNVGLGLPYHLVGCSVDVVAAGREPRRHLDYFLFSRRYCGADTLAGRHPGEDGFCRTDQYALRDESEPDRAAPVRLADVMAVSGAAVTPLRFDNWLMRVVLTVTNFRLGQWLPHPAQRAPARATLWNAVQDWPGWDETMFGNQLVFVADGGFHDNLGLEALLERRCQTIVVVDAGADPDFTFLDLTRVIQRASLRGIEFRGPGGGPLALADLLPRTPKPKDGPGEEAPPAPDAGLAGLVGGSLGSGPAEVGSFSGRTSAAHFVTAEIVYPEDRDLPTPPDDRPARLIYIKPTFTGDEPTELLTFRKANPVFPHHSTVEQLFDWAMVDAYRRLGKHIGDKVVPEAFLAPTPDELKGWRALNELDRNYNEVHAHLAWLLAAGGQTPAGAPAGGAPASAAGLTKAGTDVATGLLDIYKRLVQQLKADQYADGLWLEKVMDLGEQLVELAGQIGANGHAAEPESKAQPKPTTRSKKTTKSKKK